MEQTAETTSPEGGTNALVARPKAALQAHTGGVLPVLPRNIEEAQRYASGLIQAGILPDAFKFSEKDARAQGDLELKGKPNAPLVLMGILKCLEIGVPPQTGLGGLLPLNGRFTVWGDLAAALVQRTGQVADQTVAWIGVAFDEDLPLGQWPLDFGCEVRYWRVGQDQPYVGRYTVRDAKRANLWMNTYKKPWIEHPKRMLFNRARAFVLRDGFADGLHGLAIAEEVLDSMPVEEPAKLGSRNLEALAGGEDDSGVEHGAGQQQGSAGSATGGGEGEGVPEVSRDAGQPVSDAEGRLV